VSKRHLASGKINPYKAQTVGQAKAFFGVAPGLGLRSGKRAGFDPAAKGRGWLIVRGVIMADYYLNVRGMKRFIDDPTLCPDYESCGKRLRAKAKRLERAVKKPPCKAHIDNLAKRFLIGIVLGNALEIMRVHEGLPVDNIRAHHNYIPPKSYPDEVPPQHLLDAIRSGTRNERWIS